MATYIATVLVMVVLTVLPFFCSDDNTKNNGNNGKNHIGSALNPVIFQLLVGLWECSSFHFLFHIPNISLIQSQITIVVSILFSIIPILVGLWECSSLFQQGSRGVPKAAHEAQNDV